MRPFSHLPLPSVTNGEFNFPCAVFGEELSFFPKDMNLSDFPDGPVVENPLLMQGTQCDLWSREIPDASEQLSLCLSSRAQELQLLNY